ncbi:DMT family transporter [soil metagenome]
MKTAFIFALTILMWASAFPVIRVILGDPQGFDPFTLATTRYCIAALVLLVIGPLCGVRRPALRDLPMLMLAGFFGVSAYNVLLNAGQKTVEPGAASFLVNTIPMMTTLLAVLFLGDRLKRWGWFGMALSLCGIALISIGQGKGMGVSAGAILILLAALSWSCCTILQKPLLLRYRPLEVVCYGIWSGAALLALCMIPLIFFHESAAPLHRLHELLGLRAYATISRKSWLLITYLGFFPAALAYIFWGRILSVMSAARASSFLYITPVAATIMSYVFLDEVLNPLSMLGGIIALTGVIIVNTLGRVKKVEPRIHAFETTSTLTSTALPRL